MTQRQDAIPLRDRLAEPDLLREQALVGGLWTGAGSGATLPVEDPATGMTLGSVPDCGAPEARAAVDAAVDASRAWRRRTGDERAAILRRWHALVLAHEHDLAIIMTAEQGKPLAEALGEVRYGASFIAWFAEEARRTDGRVLPSPEPDRRILVLREPVGVSAAITPWNFPIAMITRKVAPALAAGCPMIVKPSELTPFSALALGWLAQRAGVPDGVLSIVTGQPDAIGTVLTGDERIRKLSFTGSTRVGAMLMRACAGGIKRLSLELGGNAPFIVFDDADLDLAVRGVMASKFRNAGQTCVCANRILVQDGVHDAFLERVTAEASRLKAASGFTEGATIGPLINAAAVAKVRAHVDDALQQGARSQLPQIEVPDGGHFVAPSILSNVSTAMRLTREETFGPVLPVLRFSDEAEALRIANDTPFGLASYFYTDNLHRAWRVAEALEFGMVGLNTGNISIASAPFGGVKQSGLGREGGPTGIDEYLELKSFHMGGLKDGDLTAA